MMWSGEHFKATVVYFCLQPWWFCLQSRTRFAKCWN